MHCCYVSALRNDNSQVAKYTPQGHATTPKVKSQDKILDILQTRQLNTSSENACNVFTASMMERGTDCAAGQGRVRMIYAHCLLVHCMPIFGNSLQFRACKVDLEMLLCLILLRIDHPNPHLLASCSTTIHHIPTTLTTLTLPLTHSRSHD